MRRASCQTLDPTAMHLVLFLLIALAPSLGALALMGHGAAAKNQLGRYALFSLLAWLAASLCLFGLVLWSPGISEGERQAIGGTGSLTALAAVCVVPFVLVGTILYCWGGRWSPEGHLTCALVVSVGAAALAVPLVLASSCVVQGNCL